MIDIPTDDRASADELGALVHILTGAAWWGAEVDIRYRVLALTVEPTVDRTPGPPTDDRRLQILLHPINALTGALRDRGGVETLGVEDLLTAVESLDGAALTAGLVATPGHWGQDPSFAGRSDALDGRAHGLWVRGVHDGRSVDLHTTFDAVQVRGPDGRDVPLR